MKTHALSLKCLHLLILSCCLLLLANCNVSSNDSAVLSGDVVAYIVPIDTKISIDGDLSDWPSELTRYPIQNLEIGDSLNNKQDYDAHFKIGYDVKENAILIAVEVSDHSVVKDSTYNSNWDTQDGAELYLDEKYLKSGSFVTQFSEYGDERLTFGGDDNWSNIEMKRKYNSGGRVYEWKVTLEDPIETGRAMGLDLVITDKDADGSFSWVSWTRGTQKTTNPQRCGTVVFAAPGTKTQEISGKLDLSNLTSDHMPVPVRINSSNNAKLWLRTIPDSLGNYKFLVPEGAYKLEIPPTLLEWEYRYYNIAETTSEEFKVTAKKDHKLPVLSPKLLPEPSLWAERGLLHNFGKEEEQKVDEFIEAYRNYYNIPGVSLALIKDGKIVYHKTYGYRDNDTKEPLSDKTLFEAASITKPVFAYVVLRLAEKDRIDLDKPLYEYLPFEALEKYPAYKKMTARHVLIHRSGLPNWGASMVNTPGEKYGYSGEGFEYLKRVVVHITGKPIEQVLDEELMRPFGLYHMEFSDSEALRKVVSSGHMMGVPTNWGIPQEAGMAFSMHTEARAFSKFALLLLEEKGLSPEMYKEFMSIHTESNPEYWNDKDMREGAGLGIFVRETDYGNTFNHGGNNGDFKCLFEVFPDLKMGYVLYTNSNTGSELTNDITYLLVEGNTPKR